MRRKYGIGMLSNGEWAISLPVRGLAMVRSWEEARRIVWTLLARAAAAKE